VLRNLTRKHTASWPFPISWVRQLGWVETLATVASSPAVSPPAFLSFTYRSSPDRLGWFLRLSPIKRKDSQCEYRTKRHESRTTEQTPILRNRPPVAHSIQQQMPPQGLPDARLSRWENLLFALPQAPPRTWARAILQIKTQRIRNWWNQPFLLNGRAKITQHMTS